MTERVYAAINACGATEEESEEFLSQEDELSINSRRRAHTKR